MRYTTFSLFCMLMISSCSQNERKPDHGKLINNIYTQHFFGIQVSIPHQWQVQNEDQLKALTDSSSSIIAHSNADMSLADSSQANIIQLLTVLRNPANDSTTFNPSFVLLAEKLPEKASDMDEKVYLMLTIQQLKKTGLYQGIDSRAKKVSVGGKEFFSISATTAWGETVVEQDFYVRNTRGYALVMITSYSSAQQQDNLFGMLASVKFE
jgi:hypothetical protein